MVKFPKTGLFICGTDTEVGKTYVACLIARTLVAMGHRVGVYKPVASGGVPADIELIAEDACQLWDAAGRPADLKTVCPQVFEAPIAPQQAAKAEGRTVDETLLRSGLSAWHDRCDVVVVEGAGGLMSPISSHSCNATLAEEFGYPLVVVAPNRLGVINHTLQTLIAAATFGAGLATAGIVLNQLDEFPDASVSTNRSDLQQHCSAPVLAALTWQAKEFDAPVDWLALATAQK
jgi:dethiobiotin synthetase